MMYASASARKQKGRNVIRVLAMNDGCCTAPFHSDELCHQNKLCSFPTNMLRVYLWTNSSEKSSCSSHVLKRLLVDRHFRKVYKYIKGD